MFYRKYRPKNLSELDTHAVREQLRSILSTGTIPHAFLFTGPRGTGKTSTARIVAKVLNADSNKEKLVSLEPDEKDGNVLAISQGVSADVIEIDAASNRKIDDIRELISQLKFTPLSSKYKVYIIDEVHMLTKEAFNALLKSLEEPPAHTIFILATTEVAALPKTILSRCIQIQFNRAQKDDIVTMLKRIAKGEKLEIKDGALSLIADAADGSFRDAAKMLEITSMAGKVDEDAIRKIIGGDVDVEKLISAIEKNSVEDALTWVSEAAEKGSDFKYIIERLLAYLHELLLAKYKLPGGEGKKTDLSIKQIATLMSLLQKAYGQLKITPIASLPLEIAIVEFSHV